MKTKYTYKQIWTIAYPIQPDYGAADRHDRHGLSWTCRGN